MKSTKNSPVNEPQLDGEALLQATVSAAEAHFTPLQRLSEALENHNTIDKELLLQVLSNLEARIKDLEG